MRKLLLIFISLSLLNISTASQGERKLNFLVQPFTGAGEKSSVWISKGITDTVVSDLSRIQSINVVTEEDRRRALREMELAMTGLTGDEGTKKIVELSGTKCPQQSTATTMTLV